MRQPALILVVVGLLLAVNINLAKAAHDAGASALLIALVTTGGAGLALLARAVWSKSRIAITPGLVLFYAVAGGISYALPNLVVFAAAGQIGPAFAAMLHALVPGLTYLVALGWGLDKLQPRRALGLVAGFCGAAVVVFARLGFSTDAEAAALLLALAAPVCIALGNVVRSRYWPRGAEPLDIAPGLLLFAAAELALLGVSRIGDLSAPSGDAAWILTAQAAISSVFYALYFRLQHIAGPVYLSQIGYVATAFALPIAVVVFGDKITPAMFAGVALIFVGVFLVRPARPSPASAAETLTAAASP